MSLLSFLRDVDKILREEIPNIDEVDHLTDVYSAEAIEKADFLAKRVKDNEVNSPAESQDSI